MDDETRYRIAQEVAQTKQDHDASHLFREGKRIAGKSPIRLITDGLGSYTNAYESEFKTASRQTEHIREIALDGEIHNNKMERQNEEWRDRTKVMRGFKIDDSPILKGYMVYHNFIREHAGLKGKTPSEACGITINGENTHLRCGLSLRLTCSYLWDRLFPLINLAFEPGLAEQTCPHLFRIHSINTLAQS